MPQRPPLALVVSLVVGLAAVAPRPAGAGDLLVYDDVLRSGFEDWSFGEYDLASTTHVRSGAASIAFEPSAWGGIYFHRDAGIDPAQLESLELWLHGGTWGGQADIRIALLVQDSDVVNTDLAPFIPGGAIVPGWQRIVVPFDAFPVTEVMDGFWLQAWTDEIQHEVWIDDVRMLARAPGCEPGVVEGLRLELEGAGVRLTWTPADMAVDHVVRSDADPSGAFGTVDAVGGPGLVLPLPAGPLRCWLVAGVNACGEGDLHGEHP